MIAFDADPSHTVRSASYWQQWLFAHYRGTQTLPVTNTQGDFNPLFWGATIDESCNAIYVKVSRIHPFYSNMNTHQEAYIKPGHQHIGLFRTADHQHPASLHLRQRHNPHRCRPQLVQLHLQPDGGRAAATEHQQCSFCLRQER